MSAVGYSDLFAVGLGFDITGAYLVAKGLLTGPDEYERRAAAASNSFAASHVRAAEDFADGKAGVAALIFGFFLQGVGYVLSIGGLTSETDGVWAAAIAAGSTVVAVLLASGLAHLLRWPRVRNWLVEDARWGRFGERHEHPDGQEIHRYGEILGKVSDDEKVGDPENLLRHARRVWRVDYVRGPGPDGPDTVFGPVPRSG